MGRKNSIPDFPESEKKLNFLIFVYLWAFKKFSCSTQLSMKKVLYPRAQVHLNEPMIFRNFYIREHFLWLPVCFPKLWIFALKFLNF